MADTTAEQTATARYLVESCAASNVPVVVEDQETLLAVLMMLKA